MPVYSMTGYASAQQSAAPGAARPEAKAAGAGRLGLEIRSVNSRFLDLTFRLSRGTAPARTGIARNDHRPS